MADNGAMNFEVAMARLEKIASELDNKQITLEESIKLYSQSMELVAYCKKCLEEAEGRIKVIGKDIEE